MASSECLQVAIQAPTGGNSQGWRWVMVTDDDKTSNATRTQAGLFPIAYTIGTDFKPAKRLPLEPILRWNQW
jgi:hypothetical protein